MLVNILVGLIVHRPVRSEHHGFIDDVYWATFAFWAVGVTLSVSDARIGQMVGGIAAILAGLQLPQPRDCTGPVGCWIAYTAAAAATIVVVALRRTMVIEKETSALKICKQCFLMIFCKLL